MTTAGQSDPRFIGRRVQRVEDPRFLLGRGQYIADIKLPRMAHVAFLRSPHAHARLTRIDTTRARALPGVFGVYTGEMLVGKLARPMMIVGNPPVTKTTRSYPLAVDKVRFVGDPIAVVVASSRYVAEDALDLIEVDYERLPVVIDAEQAIAAGAPLVDEDLGDNILAQYAQEMGDVAGAFATADTIVSAVFRQHRQTHVPLETRGGIADWDVARQAMLYYASTQAPHKLRDMLAALLGLPAHKLRVITPDVGGGFGQKSILQREDVVLCLIARELGRPVKWIEDRIENLSAGHHAREETCYIEAAVRSDGTILGMRSRLFTDAGAYPAIPLPAQMFTYLGASYIPGHWNIASYGFEAYTVATNKCPVGPFRAPPNIYSVVSEGIIEVIAHELGLDSVDVRRKNIVRREDQPYMTTMGFPLIFLSIDEAFEKALDLIDYPQFRHEQAQARQQSRYLGLGIATYIEPGAFSNQVYHSMGSEISGWDSATVRVEPTGQVTVMVGLLNHGQGLDTTLAQVVAEELGVDMADVTILYGDTARDPYGAGTQSSRSAVVGSGATSHASRTIREKILRIAAHLLEAAPEDMELRGGGRVGVKGVPDREVTLKDIAHTAHFHLAGLPEGETPGLETIGRYDPPFASFSNATHACVVEVDVATGQVRIDRYVVVEDCGTMLNPMVVDGQILGATVQGIGGVLYERLAYDHDGHPLAMTLADYLLPTAADVPAVRIEHIVTPSPLTPYGVKPMGEGGVLGAVPAVMNAIADALAPFGVRVTEQPFTPPRIRELLRQAGH
ncbi:MAG TPA: molybdopterin cofactor-binding domain-containing protein [Herpetosiphonaceae bacterium]